MGQPAHFINNNDLELLQKIAGTCADTHHRQPIGPEEHHMSFTEIGRQLNITRQAAQQAYARGMKKCHQWAQANGYQLQDLIRGVD